MKYVDSYHFVIQRTHEQSAQRQKAVAVAALKTPVKLKEILIPSPRVSTRDENAAPVAQEDEKKTKLMIRLPGRRRSQILTPITSTKGTLR